MITSLVGFTGFVGGNIAAKHNFDNLYNSKNIDTAFGKTHDLLVYSGVRAEKFLANTQPEKDFTIIENAIENIKKMNPKTLVLISTADVYKTPQNVDENTPIDENDLQTYGKNRYLLEKWVRENIENHLIVRLPGLFGKGIKKNFLFDMLTVIPSMLTISKYDELCQKSDLVKTSYTQLNDKFYKLSLIDSEKLQTLKTFFASNDFNALSFTDSRAAYQFYNLADLWDDINTAIDSGLHTVNLTSEPVLASEIYTYLNGGEFVNEITDTPVYYDIKSVNAACFGGKNGYIKSKDEILAEIKKGFPSKFENM